MQDRNWENPLINKKLEMNVSENLRWTFTALGAVLAAIEPAIPYMALCTLMIFADCFTAWSLSKRARKVHSAI